MTTSPELYNHLSQLAEALRSWHREAEQLRVYAYEAEMAGRVEDQRLIDLEGVAGQIYKGVESFNALLPDLAKESADGPAEFAEVGSALQLVLLEITELGTRMYRLRSSTAPRPYESGVAPFVDTF